MKFLRSLLDTIFETKKFRRAHSLLSRREFISERFIDLTPVDNADPDGLYGKALDFAMHNPTIRNIALTGPYGSGKTSVIKTYQKNSPYHFLNVSLATFSDPNAISELGPVSAAEEVTIKVERSILQQMLYGADTRTLPYSRFKRITKPTWMSLNALGFAFWIVVCGYIYRERDNILSVTTLDGIKPLWFFTCLYAFSYFTQLVARSLKASHSLSVKKLSLQNGEVELDGTPESSILNKHLDEIIYFFEENDYDVVVFEDLDRFGNPEIFIKLREINKIVNDRHKKKGILHHLKPIQPLKFIYAIKDDVFFNKDRAKFFDFIIPIVPIINNSNSREMFTRCIAPKEKEIKIDGRFVSEVSLYLDDYRLIKNISNEFLVYQGKVGGEPNLNKLLAIIIYKNTYPKDFESLHHGKGALYNIVGLRSGLIALASATADVKIDELKKSILESEAEHCSAQADLARIFWGQLCAEQANVVVNGVYVGSEIFTLTDLSDWDNFKELLTENLVSISGMYIQNGYYQVQQNQKIELTVSFREIESKATPSSRFEVRYERIKNKSTLRRNQLNAEIAELQDAKSEFARQPLHQLLASANTEIDLILSKSEISDSRLLKYLVRNGFLDETYHIYISIFHEGRMSRNDWNFIQIIRDFRPIDPNALIDNPREVVAEMRTEDFGAEYVLNVALMDYLLSTIGIHASKINSAIEFIAKNFARSDDFFQAYWVSGRAIDTFTKTISEYWSGYGVASIESAQASRHISYVLAYVEASYIAKKMNPAGALALYLSTHTATVYAERLPLENGYEALKMMSVKIENLKDIEDFNELLTFACKNSLYVLSEQNIELALCNLMPADGLVSTRSINPRLSNFTALCLATDQTVHDYAWQNINFYIEEIAIIMEHNIEESPEALLKIINHPKVKQDLAIQYILRQRCTFEDFSKIPELTWSELLFNRKIKPNWANIIQYYSHQDADPDRLAEFLNETEVVDELTGTKMPVADGNEDDIQALSWFLIDNTTTDLENYEKLCKCSRYVYSSFPKDSPLDRRLILARLGKIALNATSFSDTYNTPKLQATLIKTHFNSYAQQIENYPASLDVKLELLAIVEQNTKPKIVKWISLAELQTNEKATDRIAMFLSEEDLNTSDYNHEVVAHCLASCSSKKAVVGLLYNFIDLLTDQEVSNGLEAGPEPFCLLIKPNTRQKLLNTDRNMAFLLKLATRKIISSVSNEGEFIRINAFRKGITDRSLSRN